MVLVIVKRMVTLSNTTVTCYKIQYICETLSKLELLNKFIMKF